MRRDGGSATVTTIMVVMILMALLFVVQVGLTYHARQVLAGAVQDGASYAAVQGNTGAHGVNRASGLINRSAGNLISGVNVSASQSVDQVTISATADVVSILPGFSMEIDAQASAIRERFRSQGGG